MDEAAVRAIVRRAYLPPLIAALAQATGDLSLLRDDLRPDPTRAREAQGGMSQEQRAAARDLAAQVILRRGDGADDVPITDVETLREIVAFAIGEPVSDGYLPLLLEELPVSGTDRRAPGWTKAEIDPEREFEVAIVGAGMSGLLAAHRLSQAGVPFVVIEKNADVGGTWFENRYPGCRVDVPNHAYSYSFAQRDDWPEQFSPQAGLLDYFRDCAASFGLREHIRFDTEVVSAEFRDATADWELTVRGPGGGRETIVANVVVSAVGQLNRPRLPDIAGRERFSGPAFHSARWEAGVDLHGKRVAVIGTGASAIQVIPTIADDVAALYVCQRTPNWLMPTPQYHRATGEEMQWLLRNVPFYREWYRFWLFWRLAEGMLPAAKVDPGWDGHPDSVSAPNEAMRQMLAQYLEAQFDDRPDLLAQVMPHYPPLAKRILLDDGIWAETLKRDHVHLVAEGIDRITEQGIVTTGGRELDVDVIVYATGFRASEFLLPMRVTGRGGTELHDSWDGTARAYLGIAVPGFPNFFCLYGPNTNLVANGSIIFFSECEVNYLVGALHLLLSRRARAMDCRADVYAQFNAAVDAANAAMAWGASGVNSWYKNARGHVTQNWPYSLLEFWRRTREPDPADYELL